MMRICLLGSGSSGNSTLVAAGNTRVLLDCGISGRETVRRLHEIGEDPSRIDAIVLTHEHGDHARSLGVLTRMLDVPVYASTATLAACRLGERLKDLRRGEEVTAGREFAIGDLVFHPFSIPHDAADPLAYTVEAGGCRMGMAVDLGRFDDQLAARFRGCDALVIEANHEIGMLRAHPKYSWNLKMRIWGDHGHVSNDQMARFLEKDFDDRAEHIVLAHLSRNTNLPELARQAAIVALQQRSPLFTAEAERRVSVARYDAPSDWIRL